MCLLWVCFESHFEPWPGTDTSLVHAGGDVNSPFVHKEVEEIREVVEFERANADVTYWELLKPNMINRTHIGVFCQIWSQLTGMNVMMCKRPGSARHPQDANNHFRLYHLHLHHGGRGQQCPPSLIHSVRHQRGHDSASLVVCG